MPNRRGSFLSRFFYPPRKSRSLGKCSALALALLLTATTTAGAVLPATAASAAAAAGGSAEAVRASTLSVIGDAERGTVLAPTAVAWQDGDTPYSVLERALPGKVRASGSGETLYVSSIDGLAELDRGSKSGWMYEVNGVYPTGSASLYKLKPGDTVVWRYTLDLGTDLKGTGSGASGGESGAAAGSNGAGGSGAGSGSAGSAGSGAGGGSQGGVKGGVDGGGVDGGRNTSSAGTELEPDISELRKQLLAQPAAELTAWEAFALGRSGGGIPSAYLTGLAEQVKAAGGKFRKATDLERIVLAVRAAGGDPRAFAGYDLIAAVYNHGNLTLQGANGPIFALLALDSGGYAIPAGAAWTRAKLVDWLLALQNSDGSFPLSPGEAGNADITAMAIAALASYGKAAAASGADASRVGGEDASRAALSTGVADTADAVARAAAYLSSVQLPDGGFALERAANSETAAQVIIGLTAAGLDPRAAAFAKPGGSVLDALLAYRTAGGGFAHAPGGAADPIATEQALLAMIAYDRFVKGQPALYRIAAERFADEQQISGWAADAVHQAYAARLFSGTSASALRFEPKRGITRAELAALIVRLAGDRLEETSSNAALTFADVSPSAWYYGDVMRAARSGIVNGMTASSFKPGDAVTREQMAVMIGRAFGLNAADDDSAHAWKDASRIRPSALPYVNAVASAGILLGSSGAFDPAGQVTREIAAVAAIRLRDRELAL